MYGYIDPAQRVHEQQALRNLSRPQQQPVYFPQAQPVFSPLDGLDQVIVHDRHRTLAGEIGVFVIVTAVVLGLFQLVSVAVKALARRSGGR